MKINKTKNQFEAALFELLSKKNYHDITINEICALANKTKMTFYHYYKDKDNLLAQASINIINTEYAEEYKKILAKETNIEEIEYQSLIATYNMVTKHYSQIQNLTYRGETLPLQIFKNALSDNYSNYMAEIINNGSFDVPIDYLSIFCFEGLYGTCLYFAEQLKNNKNKKQVREENKKACRLLARAIVFTANTNSKVDVQIREKALLN